MLTHTLLVVLLKVHYPVMQKQVVGLQEMSQTENRFPVSWPTSELSDCNSVRHIWNAGASRLVFILL